MLNDSAQRKTNPKSEMTRCLHNLLQLHVLLAKLTMCKSVYAGQIYGKNRSGSVFLEH